MQPALRKTAAILILIFASLALRAQNSGELVSMEPISSHAYKTITNLETSRHGYRNECPDGVNSYFAMDLKGQDIPLGDGEIASET